MVGIPSASRALGYIRRSASSDERTASISVQQQAIEAYCARGGLVLFGTIIHDGVSGADIGRFADITRRQAGIMADHLVVYHDDRLSRDAASVLVFIRDLESRGGTLHVTGRGVVTVETSEGLLTTGIHAVIAEYQRKLISEKTKAALALRKRQGRAYNNNPEYGYGIIGGTLVYNMHEHKIIDMVMDYAEMGLSLRGIAKTLNHDGFTSRKGTIFSASAINSIIKKVRGEVL